MRYRDVFQVRLIGFYDIYGENPISQELKGVSSVSLSIEGTNFTGVGDLNKSIRYVGLTKLSPTITIDYANPDSDIRPGYWAGSIQWNIPAACYPPDGPSPHSLKITVANCVCTERRVSLNHGDLARATLTFKSVSSDGETSPISAEIDTTTSMADNDLEPSDFYRDISEPTFLPEGEASPYSLSEVYTIEWTESGTIVEDSAEDDVWMTCAFVTDLQAELSVTLREPKHSIDNTDAFMKVGTKGKFAFKTIQASSSTGLLPAAPVTLNFEAPNVTVTGTSMASNHGDNSEVTISMLMHGTETTLPYVSTV